MIRFRLFVHRSFRALNRKQRSAAASKQVAECRDDDDQRKAQADCAECRRSHIGDPRDVDAVYDVVQKTQNLGPASGDLKMFPVTVPELKSIRFIVLSFLFFSLAFQYIMSYTICKLLFLYWI